MNTWLVFKFVLSFLHRIAFGSHIELSFTDIIRSRKLVNIRQL